MKLSAWFTGLLFVCTTIACNSQSLKQQVFVNPKNSGQKNSINSANPGNVLRLTKHQVLDREGTGLVVSTYLLPADWKVNDRLYWQYDDATVPIRYSGTYQSPDGSMMVKNYADVRAVWNVGPSGTTGYRPPSDIIYGLKDLVKSEKKGINFRYTYEKTSPVATKVSNMSGSAVRQVTQSGRVKIEYEQNGVTTEEEFYGKLDVSTVVSQGVVNYRSDIWAASGLYSCKAAKGNLDKCRQVAQTIQSTARTTLPFYNRYMQVVKLLSDQVYAQIYQAGQISKIISATNDQISETITSSYWNTQKALEKSNTQFSDNMRGVERYRDGNSEYQLPSGYNNAWVNNKGEYLMSDQPGFDPSVTQSGDWKQLNKK